MKSLHTAQAIRTHIREVLSDTDHERNALVAFIGPNPLKWITRPKGLNIYCWPLAGATHPVGIDRLRKQGAKVTFVEELHAKVYHSSRGTVIGSANLSANALQGKLLETAIWLPPGAFSWKSQMAEVRKRKFYAADTQAFNDRLERLRREHVAFSQRNPRSTNLEATDAGDIVETETTEAPSFSEWLRTPGRSSWQLGGWSFLDSEPTDSLQAFEEEVGTKPKQYIGTQSRTGLALRVATLAFRYTPANGAAKNSLLWWFPEKMKKSADAEWAEHPYVWMASENIPSGCAAPFDIKETRFRNALDKTVREIGYERVERMRGPVNERFLGILANFYADAPER